MSFISIASLFPIATEITEPCVEMEPPSVSDLAYQEQAESPTNPHYTYSMSSKKFVLLKATKIFEFECLHLIFMQFSALIMPQ